MKNGNENLSILGKFKRWILSFRFSAKLIFILTGIASTVWFLVRVIPKPQRAGYPCMRAAAPMMSGFVMYIIALGGSSMLFKRSIERFRRAKYVSAFVALVLCMIVGLAFNLNRAEQASANSFGFTRGELPDGPNNPMGVGRGINPGRVVWDWNATAVNQDCPNVITDAFFMSKNNNQDTINRMADNSIKSLAGKTSVSAAWDAIFKSFNKGKTGTESAYQAGQKIFIKVNNGQAGWAINQNDLSERGNNSATGVQNAAMAGTTPATVVALIRQLVDSCGIAQGDIYVGEPMTHVYKSMYDAVHSHYPDVIILDKDGNTSLGRTKSAGWTDNVIFYSDKGTEMPDAVGDNLMKEMYDADYMINVAALKAHARGGVSLCAKLHFGSHGDHPGYGYGSFHLHDGLISTVDNDYFSSGVRGDYHMYRVLVDLMGHKKLGLNTVLFVVDGLWGGIEATDMPVKWDIAPFKGEYPASLFMSQDEVALESVCIDFLRAEADHNAAFKDRPFFPAVDDFLHQAADPANWPAGISYDPENDGTPISSLGVHEHWNNPTDKAYTRNLGTGDGIELVSIFGGAATGEQPSALNNSSESNVQLNIYPNPCTVETMLSYSLHSNAHISIQLVSTEGRIVKEIRNGQMKAGTYTDGISTSDLRSGLYFCVIKTQTGNNTDIKTEKLWVNQE